MTNQCRSGGVDGDTLTRRVLAGAAGIRCPLTDASASTFLLGVATGVMTTCVKGINPWVRKPRQASSTLARCDF